MKKAFLILFLIIAIPSQSQELIQNNDQTKVMFKIKNFGVNVDGDFSDVTIKTNFNSNKLSESYINAEIAVKSIATGIKGRDKSILKKGYFDEANYKIIQLKSTKIEKKSEGNFMLYANLTIKKTTKSIEIPLEVLENDSSMKMKANFMINRKDYKVGGGSLILSKKVKIQVIYTGSL
ncbi:MAG: YceI family protein [Flavobacteriaceae bacterium]